jgi:hypothetical protein
VVSSKENGLPELKPSATRWQPVSPPLANGLQNDSPELKSKEPNVTQRTIKEPPPKGKGKGASVLTAVKGLLLSPYALPAILIVFVEAITMGAVDTLVLLFLMDTCHRSAAESGLIFGALALTYAGAAYWGTSWADGQGEGYSHHGPGDRGHGSRAAGHGAARAVLGVGADIGHAAYR